MKYPQLVSEFEFLLNVLENQRFLRFHHLLGKQHPVSCKLLRQNGDEFVELNSKLAQLNLQNRHFFVVQCVDFLTSTLTFFSYMNFLKLKFFRNKFKP